MCAECGIAWIGPQTEQIKLMGDKARAKDFARQQAVPVLAGQSLQGLAWPDIKHAAAKIGFPLVLKASYGGGGKVFECLPTFMNSINNCGLRVKKLLRPF